MRTSPFRFNNDYYLTNINLPPGITLHKLRAKAHTPDSLASATSQALHAQKNDLFKDLGLRSTRKPPKSILFKFE